MRMRTRLLMASLLLMCSGAACSAAPPGPGGPCASAARTACREKLQVAPGWDLPYYSNYSLTGNPTPTHAVVVVHGLLRNSHDYFRAMLSAASTNAADAQTMVIAPHFQASQDHPGAHEPYWAKEGWQRGDGAEAPPGLSSFAVMDQIVAALADKARFPHLTWVTIAGHSAGAQFTQRYAAAGRAPLVPGLLINYVIANPSSYLYFTPDRPYPADPNCAYNNYKYGLNNPNPYVGALSASQIIGQYTTRRITYLQGGADVLTGGPESHDLDTSCAAEAQGPNRLERGAHYYDYIRSHFPNAPQNRVVVPGVGHDDAMLFGSEQGRAVLFTRPAQS